METVDYILVGQGVAGTLLGWEMRQAGLKIAQFDDGRGDAASRLAAGIINPVSGRKFEVAWQYDVVYPRAKATYRAMEAALGISVFTERDIWNVWTSAQMRDAFAQHPTPYSIVSPAPRYAGLLEAPFGAGIVSGANVDLGTLLPAWAAHAGVRRETLDIPLLQLTDKGVEYKGLQAKAVIFCEGVASPQNPWFGKLKFLPNKGEALIVRLPFDTTDIIKKGVTLVPLGHQTFWAGATFSWDYPDTSPTPEARAHIESQLRQLLKTDFEVIDHKAAVRPSGPDRRPMAGLHPKFPQVGIFNGMGSKGCSLAPWAAAKFVGNLVKGEEMPPEIDITRFFNALR
ncbi:FAD-dependent oxidoreductase [Chitinophaga caseinilytica]|uniref:FAD-dependent oxidoreductase n=1 Tax=Chitinophaga caseinilytica TaxID=2267521 RepID=A0ABZ2ZC54_9BACT